MPRNSHSFRVVGGLTMLFLAALTASSWPGKLSRAARLQDEAKTSGSRPTEATSKDAALQDEPPLAASPSLPGDPMPIMLPLNAPEAANVAAFAADPEKSADEFLARTRKEASDAVEALNTEAAQLRERLAKVEAGLARYKATLDALNTPPPAGKSPEGQPALNMAQPPPAEGGALEPSRGDAPPLREGPTHPQAAPLDLPEKGPEIHPEPSPPPPPPPSETPKSAS